MLHNGLIGITTNPPPTLAAVDIGSNTIKLTVATRLADGTLVERYQDAETVRLGAGIVERGELDPARVERAIDCLTRFRDAARERGALDLIGVATEAIRRAADGATFVERAARETGWRIRVISGDEEARLAFEGLQELVRTDAQALIADIGGGSTELIWTQSGGLRSARSLPIGSGQLTDQWMRRDPPTPTEVDGCRSFVLDFLRTDPQLAFTGQAAPTRMVISGGTGVYLGVLVGKRELIEESDLQRAMSVLTSVPSSQLAELLQLPSERARVLPAGVAVVTALQIATGVSRILVTESGLRRGLLRREFARRLSEGRESS